MKTYFVETYRPPFPVGGVCFRVHSSPANEKLNPDILSPDMTSVSQVTGVKSKNEAIAVLLESVAGIKPSPGVTIRLKF